MAQAPPLHGGDGNVEVVLCSEMNGRLSHDAGQLLAAVTAQGHPTDDVALGYDTDEFTGPRTLCRSGDQGAVRIQAIDLCQHLADASVGRQNDWPRAQVITDDLRENLGL
jgi:hypothetical protein